MNLVLLKILLQILADRALVFTALFLNFGLFAYAIMNPNNWTFAISGLFSVTVFYPVLRYSHQKGVSQHGQTGEQAA